MNLSWALVFWVLCELQTNSVLHISQTEREDPLGPAAVCFTTGITRVLWSHSAMAHFAGKEWDDVMLFALHQHGTYRMHYGRKRLRNQCNNNTSVIISRVIFFKCMITVHSTMLSYICTHSSIYIELKLSFYFVCVFCSFHDFYQCVKMQSTKNSPSKV